MINNHLFLRREVIKSNSQLTEAEYSFLRPPVAVTSGGGEGGATVAGDAGGASGGEGIRTLPAHMEGVSSSCASAEVMGLRTLESILAFSFPDI